MTSRWDYDTDGGRPLTIYDKAIPRRWFETPAGIALAIGTLTGIVAGLFYWWVR